MELGLIKTYPVSYAENCLAFTTTLSVDAIELIIGGFTNSIEGSDDTKNTYVNGVRKFLTWCMEENKTELVPQDLKDYKQRLIDDNSKANTICTHISSLRQFYRYLETLGVKNIAADLKGVKQSRDFKKLPLSVQQSLILLDDMEAEVKKLCEGVDLNDKDNIPDALKIAARDYALISTFLRGALREKEASLTDRPDIIPIGDKTALYIQGKGHFEKDEFIIITQRALKPLMFYLSLLGVKDLKDPEQPLFISFSDRTRGQRLKTRSIRHIVKQHFLKVGINSEKITTHSLRHTAVTLALLGGATLEEAQELARHLNISTTQIYAHHLNRVENPPENYIDNVLVHS